MKHIGYILFQNPQPLPTLNITCYNTITMKNTTKYKPNITVFVGRSEQSDLRHLIPILIFIVPLLDSTIVIDWKSFFCRSDLLVAISYPENPGSVFVGRSEQRDLRHLTFCRTDIRHLTFCRTDIRHLTFCKTDIRQIAKNKRYSFSSFLRHSKPVKTTHKPSQVQQQDHNTVKIQ